MAFTLLINGTDRSAYVKVRPEPSWRVPIRGQRGDSNFTLSVATSNPFVPAARQRVTWKDNGNTVWTGTIDRVQVTHEAPLLTERWYLCSAVSDEQRLDKLFVTRSFATGTTCGAIFSSVLSTEAASEGIAAGTVQSGATLTEPMICEQMRVSDVFTDLQRRSGDFVWYIKNQTAYFEARATTTAPFTVTDAAGTANMLASPQPTRRYDRSNYRNRQHLRLQERYIPPYRRIFAGDSSTYSFTLDQSVREIISVTLTTATKSTTTGTFTGVPSNGDTMVIGSTTYTFRSSASASAFNRGYSVLIGASASATATNLVNAINDTGTGRGSTYGWPCKQHPNVYASASSGTVTLTTVYVGDWTSAVTTTESVANFTWSGTWTAGTNGTDTAQTFSSSIGDANNSQWSYTVGGTSITQNYGQTPPPTGTSVVVVYKPLSYGVLTVEDSAEVATVATAESGSGIYENMMQRSDLKSYADAVEFGGKILDALMTVNETITWDTDTYGLFPGQLATINCSRLGVNTTYMIQAVQARFVGTQSNRLHFRYNVTAQSATHATTFLDFWVPLAEQPASVAQTTTSTGNTTTSSPPSGGTPTWDNDARGQIASFGFADDTVGENASAKYVPVHRGGNPFRGYLTWATGADISSPYVPAPSKFDVLYSQDGGSTWDSIFDSPTLYGTNLTVDASTATDVTPDGHSPVSADIGKVIRIKSGTGFTTGYYTVDSIQSGKWRLSAAPAAVSTAAGVWTEALGVTVASDLLSLTTHSLALYGFGAATLTAGDLLRGDCLLSAGMADILLTVEWQPQGLAGTGTALQLGGSGAGQSFFLAAM